MGLQQTDPELLALFDSFAFDEVVALSKLDSRTRLTMIMAATIGAGAVGQYKLMVEAALDVGVSPVEVKEVLYQATAYVGMAKAFDFLNAANEVLQERGIKLPLEKQSTTNPKTRAEKGLAAQKEIFGEGIDKNYASSPKDQLHIQKFLSANCFGDFYTRTGLSLAKRELVTLSILIAMGGTEAQIKGHVHGNLNVGNDREVLMSLMTQLLPWVGYPRTLTALTCLNEIAPEKKEA